MLALALLGATDDEIVDALVPDVSSVDVRPPVPVPFSGVARMTAAQQRRAAKRERRIQRRRERGGR